jgi:hypothetical protein
MGLVWSKKGQNPSFKENVQFSSNQRTSKNIWKISTSFYFKLYSINCTSKEKVLLFEKDLRL